MGHCYRPPARSLQAIKRNYHLRSLQVVQGLFKDTLTATHILAPFGTGTDTDSLRSLDSRYDLRVMEAAG